MTTHQPQTCCGLDHPASPVAAGVFAQLNDLVLAKGDPPLGFLNPLIYQNAQAFFDVTSGINDEGTGIGFTAVAGWDPATGFGSVDYAKFEALLTADLGAAAVAAAKARLAAAPGRA